MATGRTVEKYTRVYASGYDLSGFSRAIGPLELSYEEADVTAPMLDTVKSYLRNHAQVNLGTLNALFDNTATTCIHAALATSGQARTVLVAKGIQAAPAAGDPVFGGTFLHKGYQVEAAGPTVLVSCPWSGWAADASSLLYASPWGVLLHANGAETGANSGTGHDNPTGGATALGGVFVYQVLAAAGAGSMTATLSVDDSADNSSFSALSGATSGSIACNVRSAGIVAIGTAAAVRRYLRWQLALGTATSVTFVSAFMRAY